MPWQDFQSPSECGCLQSRPLAAAANGKARHGIHQSCVPTPTPAADLSTGAGFQHQQMPCFAGVSPQSLPAALARSDALLLNTKVYIIGGKLDVQPLKELAKRKFEEIISDQWNGASFVTSLRLVYDETFETKRLLKDIIVKTASEHVEKLCT